METVYTFCIQKLCKMYTTDLYKMDIYKMYTTFQQTFVYILFTKLKELWQLIFYIKRLQKFLEMWDTFCIQFVYILHTSILIYKTCAS